jgi:hypothetical protein
MTKQGDPAMERRKIIGQAIIEVVGDEKLNDALIAIAHVLSTVIGATAHQNEVSLDEALTTIDRTAELAKSSMKDNWWQMKLAAEKP